VNGEEARFLIDSGATVTAISPDLARRAGVELDDSLPAFVQTANGRVTVQRGRIAQLAVGPITSDDLAIVSAEAFGSVNVLGMNFLSSLRSWRVEGREMILEPQRTES
jgi:aspartyl protease family protein